MTGGVVVKVPPITGVGRFMFIFGILYFDAARLSAHREVKPENVF